MTSRPSGDLDGDLRGDLTGVTGGPAVGDPVRAAATAGGGTARPLGRRAVLTGLGGLLIGGATVTFVGACGSGGGGGNALDQPTDDVKKAIADAVNGGKIEVGKAAFLSDAGVVVTRPTADTYHAFSNVCPHAGGHIDRMSDSGKALMCPLHGSQFDIATGAVVEGPATSSLPGRAVTASGGSVTLG